MSPTFPNVSSLKSSPVSSNWALKSKFCSSSKTPKLSEPKERSLNFLSKSSSSVSSFCPPVFSSNPVNWSESNGGKVVSKPKKESDIIICLLSSFHQNQ